MRKPISFVVIAHQNHHTLGRCMESIEVASRATDELILVLNNPDSKTKDVAYKRAGWQILFEDKIGPQHARNLGAYHSKHEFLCFLDSDISISKEWPDVMAANFQSPWVVLGQSKIDFEASEGVLHNLKLQSYANFCSCFYKENFKMVNLSLDTATMMVRKNWFLKVGGFDQQFNRLEDTDFSLRVLYHGGDIFYEDRIAAVELHDPADTLLSFLKKRYQSATYLPLLLKNHCINYYFPFFSMGETGPNLKFWDWIYKLIELAGLANSPHQLVVSAQHWIRFLPNSKKQALGLVKNPNERSVWVGGVERTYDLLTRRFC